MSARRFRRKITENRSDQSSAARTIIWKMLWREDPVKADAVCDRIVRNRPTPKRLLEAIEDAPENPHIRQVKGR